VALLAALVVAMAMIAGCGKPQARPKYTHASTSKETRRDSVAQGAVSRTKVEQVTKPWLGTPYRYGGASTRGIDCSGLTQTVMGDLGANVPRTVRDQSSIGAPVTAASIAPGDLVFFRLSSTKIDHVGVALDANRFVHASSSRGVVVDHLMDQYFSKRFAGARRVLEEEQ
jgi:cell wall-associated NlpC family hydrolase